MFEGGGIMSYLLAFFQGLTVPALGLFGAFIAYQQYRINHRSFNERLFDRRLAVFDAAHSFLSQFLSTLDLASCDVSVLIKAIQRSRFLFPKRITLYLTEIHEKACRHYLLSAQYKQHIENEAKRRDISAEQYELNVWFGKQSEVLFNEFETHLRFER